MHKLSRQFEGSWIEWSYPASFALQSIGNVERVMVGVPSGSPEPFEHLVLSLNPPYLLLYVLHTPRGEGAPGRYQSLEFTAEDFHVFMQRLGSFFSSDARFDIWAYSPSEHATVVWDRHNHIFAYGPVERFSSELRALGFNEGSLESSVPHQHHYWPEFDGMASELLSSYSWSHSPLRPEDEQ